MPEIFSNNWVWRSIDARAEPRMFRCRWSNEDVNITLGMQDDSYILIIFPHEAWSSSSTNFGDREMILVLKWLCNKIHVISGS